MPYSGKEGRGGIRDPSPLLTPLRKKEKKNQLKKPSTILVI
jgi:hypothetical protein